MGLSLLVYESNWNSARNMVGATSLLTYYKKHEVHLSKSILASPYRWWGWVHNKHLLNAAENKNCIDSHSWYLKYTFHNDFTVAIDIYRSPYESYNYTVDK